MPKARRTRGNFSLSNFCLALKSCTGLQKKEEGENWGVKLKLSPVMRKEPTLNCQLYCFANVPMFELHAWISVTAGEACISYAPVMRKEPTLNCQLYCFANVPMFELHAWISVTAGEACMSYA